MRSFFPINITNVNNNSACFLNTILFNIPRLVTADLVLVMVLINIRRDYNRLNKTLYAFALSSKLRYESKFFGHGRGSLMLIATNVVLLLILLVIITLQKNPSGFISTQPIVISA